MTKTIVTTDVIITYVDSPTSTVSTSLPTDTMAILHTKAPRITRKTSYNSQRTIGSRAPNDSSHRKIENQTMITQTIPTRCYSPPKSERGIQLPKPSKPSMCSSSSATERISSSHQPKKQ